MEMNELFNESGPVYLAGGFSNEINRVCEDSEETTLVMLDIDHFKRVNDEFGHKVGDGLLIEIGEALLRIDAPEKTVYRYSGDQFAVILRGMEKERAFLIMEKLRGEIGGSGECLRTGASVSAGIATYPEDGLKPAELIRKAEGALYRAKSTGKNKVCLAKEEKLVTKTTHYTVEQLKRLKGLSEYAGTGEAALMREALDDLLAKYDKRKKLERTALIVDDSGIMRDMLKDMLNNNGITVTGTAPEGATALNALENSTNMTPDFILLDISMPEMDGFEFLQKFNRKPKTHVIMVTADASPQSVAKCYKLGADAYIVKPFQRESIIDAVDNIEKFAVPAERIDEFERILNEYCDNDSGKSALTQDDINSAIIKCNNDNTAFGAYIDEELINQAIDFVIEKDCCVSSWLRQKFSIGANKANELVKILEDRGIVSRGNNNIEPRKVLVSKKVKE